MSSQQFLLPDVGEGLTEATIVTWRVAVGDPVEVNDTLVEIETEKSLVELPSPYAGTVSALLVGEGETVAVHTAIITVDSAPPAYATDPAPAVLVGYGPSEGSGVPRRRRPRAVPPPDAGAVSVAVAERPAGVRAKPPVRKLAKDLGVDLAVLPATNGLITRDDVLRHAERVPAQPAAPVPGRTRIPVRGVRKATAAAVSSSAFTAPHVTEFVTVDVTRAVKLVERLRNEPALGGSRVTMLLLVARALLATVREFPEINASWDEQAGEIVLLHAVNLGFAVASPRGLVVPNIKDAGAMSLPVLAKALSELVDTARSGRATPADMSDGTITITNIGVYGVDSGTPILNPGEAAILCTGAVRRRPWEHRGRVALRSTMQLSLSFDHRLVDGELGSRVLARVGAILENPQWELLMT